MNTEKGTVPGTTRGRVYCCDARGDTLFHFDAQRKGNAWYNAEGRDLMLFLTEMFNESPEVKQARLVVPAQDLRVFIVQKDRVAKAIHAERIKHTVKEEQPSNEAIPHENANLGVTK